MKITGIIPLSGRGRDPNLPFDFDLVFYRIRNRQYARAYVIPADPHTAARRRMRRIMRAVSKAYSRGLSPAQYRAWIAAGETVWSRRRLTRGRLTGQDLFVKLNTVLRLLGRKMLPDPPERAKFAPNPVEKLRIRRRHGRVSLKLRVAGPVLDDIMVYGEAPCSPARKKCRHPVYLGLLPAPVGCVSDITEQYVARFGEPEPGKRVMIRTRQQRNGWQDKAKDVSERVPVRVVATPRKTPRSTPLNTGNTRKGLGAWVEDGGWRRTCLQVWEYQRVAPCTRESRRSNTVVPSLCHACNPQGARVAAGAERGCLSRVRRLGPVGDGCGRPGKRRKCHWRELWRGS